MLKMALVKGCSALVIVSLLMASSLAAETRFPEQTIVATRGTASVTMLDVDAALYGLTPRQRANFMNSPKRIEELIDRLLINQQLANEARAAKLDQSAQYREAVKQQADKILSEQMAMKLRTDLPIGDVEMLAKERYDVNPNAYTIPGRADVRHILIDTKSRSDAEAKSLAESVRARALAGEDFIALVQENSDDGSKRSNDGEIPDGEADSLDPDFRAAVKKLKTNGEISPLVKTQFGYHIIMLVQRYPAQPQSFDEVKERIVTELANRLRDERVKEHIDQLKSMEIKATPDVVASLRTRYLPEGGSAEPSIPEEK